MENTNQTNKVSITSFVAADLEPITDSTLAVPFQIRRRVPYEEIFDAINQALMLIASDQGYISEPVVRVALELKLVQLYTNIDLPYLNETNLQTRKIYELYDIITSTGIYDHVHNSIDAAQRDFFFDTTRATLQSIREYRNSAAGLVETISLQSDQSKATFDKLVEDLKDPNNELLLRALGSITQTQNQS